MRKDSTNFSKLFDLKVRRYLKGEISRFFFFLPLIECAKRLPLKNNHEFRAILLYDPKLAFLGIFCFHYTANERMKRARTSWSCFLAKNVQK